MMSLEEKSPANNEYADGDVANWKKRAAAYAKFLEQIPWTERTKSYNGKGKENPDPLRLFFLGEKPAIFRSHFSDKERTVLEKFGFHFAGDFLYDHDSVLAIVNKYPKEFEGLPTESPESMLRAFSEKNLGEWSIPRGLILGFPWSSVVTWDAEMKKDDRLSVLCKELLNILGEQSNKGQYLLDGFFGDRKDLLGIKIFLEAQFQLHQEKLGINTVEIPELMKEVDRNFQKKTIYVSGMQWVDFGSSSPESMRLQTRLRTALLLSGIRDPQKEDRQ